jgi:hypothetical protein
MQIKVKEVMDHKKVASSIHSILDVGIGLLNKKGEIGEEGHEKLKVIKTISSPLNAAVNMVQQEMAAHKCNVVLEKYKQLGYDK